MQTLHILLDHGAKLDSPSLPTPEGTGHAAKPTTGRADAVLLAATYHIEAVLKAFIKHEAFEEYALRNGVDVMIEVMKSVDPEFERYGLVEEVECMLREKGFLATAK